MLISRQLSVVFACSTLLALASSCNQEKQQKSPDFTVPQWLSVCSPFASLDGATTITFRLGDHSVEIAEAIGDERDRGAFFAKNPKISRGTWTVDEAIKNVNIDLGGVTKRYTLVVPFSEGQCILSAGAIDAANLRNSWFGEPDFSGD
jgi:hypothetical protein